MTIFLYCWIKLDKHIMNSAYFTMFWAVEKYSILFHTGQIQPSPPLRLTWPHQMLDDKKLCFMSALPQWLDSSVNYPEGLVSLPVLNKLQISALVLVFLSRLSEADTFPTHRLLKLDAQKPLCCSLNICPPPLPHVQAHPAGSSLLLDCVSGHTDRASLVSFTSSTT